MSCSALSAGPKDERPKATHPQDRLLQRGDPARKRSLPCRPGCPRNGSRSGQPTPGWAEMRPMTSAPKWFSLPRCWPGNSPTYSRPPSAAWRPSRPLVRRRLWGPTGKSSTVPHSSTHRSSVTSSASTSKGESIICFADDRAEAGGSLVVPLWHKNAAATRTHYQTITTRIGDAPRPGEIVVVVGASTGPRPHARIGDRLTDPVVKAETLGELVS